METKDKDRVAKTLKEECVKIRVGVVRCKIRPLTLYQIYEVGKIANDIEPLNIPKNGRINVLHQMLEHGNDAKIECDVFVTCAFKSNFWRKLLRRYIMKRLRPYHMNELIQFLSKSFDINFFLTSITFLTQMKIMTEPKTTPLGQQSEQ